MSNNESNDTTAPSSSMQDADREANTAAKMLRLFSILETRTKYDACLGYLSCLEEDANGKRILENAKFSCVNGDFPKCGFDKIWSKGIRNQILIKEFDNDTSKWVEKLNPKSSFATDVWLDDIYWRAYEYKEGPSMARHAKEVARQAAAERAIDADDGDYSPGNESKSARNLCLVTH